MNEERTFCEILKNQPTLFKTERRKGAALKLSRESLKVIYEAADRSGLSPQTVLEDVVLAGEFFMRTAYSNLHNLRNRIKEKAKEPSNVIPVRSVGETGETNGSMDGNPEMVVTAPGEQNGSVGSEAVPYGSLTPEERRGFRPEDNPAFGNASELGDVVGVVGLNAGTRAYLAQDDPPHYADEGPIPTDEEGNPIEPQEVHEEEV